MPETLDIFVIEDDEDARASLTDILELDDHRVRCFSTAHALVEHDAMSNVDVVLIDRKLPDGLAEELLPKLKSLATNADFIVITGYADLNAAIVALREGVSDYLIKPIDAGELRATLARIAQRRSVERELYRQRRFAEKLLGTAEAIILVLDARGRILRANPYLLELTGYTLDEVIEADWFARFIPERDQARMRGVFAQAVKQIKSRGITNPIRAKDGREFEIRWSHSTLRDSDGNTTVVLCVGLDVTDFVKAQKQLLQSERLATIGQTMTGLAHESRNALQRLQNAVELLQEELAGQPQALKDLAKIERAGQHIRDLLEEVRAFAAPINLHRTEETLPKIWRRAWRSLAHRVEGRDVSFTDSISEIDDCRLSVDARRLEQVFRNLFENALDATDHAINITVTCQLTPDWLKVSVRDDGPGISEEHRHTMFDAFTTTKPTGTGLGLAICRRTMNAHGGNLSLLPSDSGAAFLIELPKRQVNTW